MEELLDVYERFNFLMGDIYKECLENGYTKSGAIGKIKYELLPMAKTDDEKAILYFELAYFLSKEELSEEFSNVYEEYKVLVKNTKVMKWNINPEQLRAKQDKITKYAKKLNL